MTLEILNQEIIKAMKAGDTLTRDVLRSAVGNIKKAAIDKKQKDNITEVLVDEVLLKEQKTLQEMIDTCPKDRVEVLEVYKRKLAKIQCYLPKLMNDPEEIRDIVVRELAAAGIESVKANKGVAMKTLMPIFKGKADMKIVNHVITEELI